MNNDWKRIAHIALVDSVRTGWIGVYDAIKSAITGKPRIIVAVPSRLSMYIKQTDDGYLCSGLMFEVIDDEQTN